MYTQYSRWFFKNNEELFRTLNRHRLTAEEGVLSAVEEDGEEAVVSGILINSSSLIWNCCVVVDNIIKGGALIDDDLLWLLKHDLRVIADADGMEVDPITAVAAVAIETDDDFLMTGISSIGNLGFDFINDVVIATTAEPFTLDTGTVGWEAENMAYTLSDSSDQWAEHNRYSNGTQTSFLSIQRPRFTYDSKYGPWQ